MKKIYLWMLALFACWQADAQVNAYTFSSAVQTYVPITGGTVVASGGALDSEEFTIALPVPFNYNNQLYNNVEFSANGSLYLGFPETETVPTGVIKPLSINLMSSTAAAEMRWQQIGDEMVFQWTDMKRKITSPANSEHLNFQARLNLVTGKILMVYGTFSNISATTTYSNFPTVGLRGDDVEDFFYRRLTNTVPDNDPSWNDTDYAVSYDQNVRLTSTGILLFPESGLTYTWTPPGNVIDLAVSSFPINQTTFCPISGLPLKMKIKNMSAFPLDLSQHPATVEIAITGAATQTFSQVLDSGILERDGEREIILSPGTDFTTAGQYLLTARVIIANDFATNDNQSVSSMTIRPIFAIPLTESFGSTTHPDEWTIYSGWNISAEHGKTTNGLYKQFNNNSSSSSFELPSVGPVGASDFLEFDFRAVDVAGYPAFPATIYWGKITVNVSTDCGRTFSTIGTIDAQNYVASTTWTHKIYPLAAYAGQNIRVMLDIQYNLGNYFLDFDNVTIRSNGAAPPTLCATVSSPANGTSGILNGDVTLDWTAATSGSIATSYDVYFGTTSGELTLLGNTTQTNYVVQAPQTNMTYYWKIVAKSDTGGNAVDCAVWNFHTCAGANWYQDLDGDTFGSASAWINSCAQPAGYVANNTDCDDTNPMLYQKFAFYYDDDGDGHGSDSSDDVCAINAQTPPAGYVTNNTDCDDDNASIHTSFPFYVDADGDGFGTGTTELICAVDANTPPTGYSINNTDCDDSNVIKYRTFPFYTDADGDGYGTGAAVLICHPSGTLAPTGYSVNNTDCDDNNVSIYRSATLYIDTDGDTYTTQTAVICYGLTVPAGYRLVARGNDCDDQNPSIYRSAMMYVDADHDNYSVGAGEVKCYGVSLPAGYSLTSNGEDCNDNNASQHGLFPFYADNDDDGYGAGALVNVCAASAFVAPDGYSLLGSDCDDNNAAVRQRFAFYADADGDGYGTGTAVLTCAANSNTPPAGFSSNATDCNDNDATVYRNGAVYVDADNDTYTAGSVTMCYGATPPAGYRATSNGFDCDDNDAAIYRFVTLYHDLDSDGYTTGSAGTICIGAQAPSGFSLTTNGIDCDDANALVYRTVSAYVDADNDGYTVGNLTNICTGETIPSGFVLNSLGNDCNDNNATVNPNAAEIPNDGIDNNCNGQTDEGASGATTQLLNAACGSTLASINSLIGINTTYPGTGRTTAYRIRLTNGSQVQTIEKTVPHFTLTQFPSYDYATTYGVAIELQQNGIWTGIYGPTCTISSPAITAVGGAGAVIPSQCGAQLASINTLIATTSLQGVSGYRFRITNLTDTTGPNHVQVIDRNLHWFSLQMLQRYNYGTTYKVEVAVKTNGAFGLFGQPCEVSSPAAPTLVNCGATIERNTMPVAANSLSGATQYRFMITRISDGASVTIDRNTNFFVLNSMQSLLVSGASYAVKVAVMTSGNWSPFGTPCMITAPGGTTDAVVESSKKAIEVVAYPNPFIHDFNLTLRSEIKQNATVKVYDLWGRLLESTVIDAATTNEVTLGGHYPAGVYQVVVSQGENVKTLHVIKR